MCGKVVHARNAWWVGVSPVCTPDGCGVFAGEVSLVGQEVEVFRCYTRPWFSAVVSDHNLITGALTIMDANVLMPYTLERSKVQIRLPQGVKGERGRREGKRGGEGLEGRTWRGGRVGEGVKKRVVQQQKLSFADVFKCSGLCIRICSL